jgi:hypothetical protein
MWEELPLELWLVIVENFEDTLTVLNVYNTCSWLRNLVRCQASLIRYAPKLSSWHVKSTYPKTYAFKESTIAITSWKTKLIYFKQMETLLLELNQYDSDVQFKQSLHIIFQLIPSKMLAEMLFYHPKLHEAITGRIITFSAYTRSGLERDYSLLELEFYQLLISDPHEDVFEIFVRFLRVTKLPEKANQIEKVLQFLAEKIFSLVDPEKLKFFRNSVDLDIFYYSILVSNSQNQKNRGYNFSVYRKDFANLFPLMPEELLKVYHNQTCGIDLSSVLLSSEFITTQKRFVPSRRVDVLLKHGILSVRRCKTKETLFSELIRECNFKLQQGMLTIYFKARPRLPLSAAEPKYLALLHRNLIIHQELFCQDFGAQVKRVNVIKRNQNSSPPARNLEPKLRNTNL